jgi:virginiamycin B lyase
VRVVLAVLAALVAAPAAQAAPAIREFPLPTAMAQPQDIVAGLDGNMWFTERGGNKIGRISASNPGAVTEFPIAAMGSAPDIIVVGPDAALWYTELSSNSIGRMPPGNPAGVTRFTGLGLVSPRGIAVGPDGNLWVVDADAASPDVQRVSPAGAAVGTPIPLPPGFNPRGIARGADGNMWVANFSTPGSVARVTTGATPTATNFPVPAGSPIDLIRGEDGNIWYAGQGTTVGRVTPSGGATAFTSKGVDPFGVTLGPDGAVWFAEFQAGAVGRVDRAGTTSHVTGMTAGAGPRYVSAGPSGTIWFTEETGNRVGRVTGIDLGRGAPGSPADRTRPAFGPVRLSSRRVRRGRTIAVRYSISEAATVTLFLERVLTGRKVGKRCVAPKRSNRERRRCARYRRVKPTLTFAAQPAGKGKILLTPRVKPGLYRLNLGARDAAGNRSKRLVTHIRVLPRKRRGVRAANPGIGRP